MKGKKTDSETRVKIGMLKFENPDLSVRDIAGEVGESKSNVHRIIEDELGQIGTNDKAKDIRELNLDIIAKGKALISSSIGTLPLDRYSDLSQLSTIVETAFKQNQLLDGGPTEIIESIGDSQAEIIAQRFLKLKDKGTGTN